MRENKKYLLFLVLGLLSFGLSYSQATRKVTGTVRDSVGQGIPGISVTVKGTKTSTMTDLQGNYSVSVSSSNDVLEFTAIGFQTQDVSVGSNTNLNVTLRSQTGSMNEVVVTALGIRREQRKLGYATSTISAQEIIKTSPTNFASALYGKAPGVTVTTNPGGATSAVSVQIRGINSLSFQRQPLLVVDGVVIRNGDANNEGYWGGNQRLNGNGMLDINPENIESINILKGAAASALYGSDANFGVIVITTKNGRKSNGLGIDVNISGNIEQVAEVPDLQTEYGPGYDRGTNMAAFGADDSGWLHKVVNGQNVEYPIFRAYGQFGPKVDGRQVYWWDGQFRPYISQPNNWKEFYRTGYSTVENIALNNSNDKFNYRFSYTRNDYQGIQIGGSQKKNTFNLNTTYRINSKLSTDVVLSYTNEFIHNRPRQIYYVTNNYGGFFSPVDYMDVYFNKYQTSKGYKWVDWNQTQLDPEEAIKYNIRAKDFLDFLWNQLANSYDETTNRLVGAATLNYNIIKGLNFRGRMGTDYTGYYLEEKDKSTQPIAYGPTGFYGTQNNRYIYTYGDLLLTYNHKITQDLNATLSAGYQARKEDYRYESAGTRNGLTTENWFSLNASAVSPPSGTSSRSYLVKDGLFGILSLDYHNYLFVEGTLRRERTSTLFPGKNTFNYPGVSAAFELTNAFHLPEFINYSKVRGAWGIVGNPPPPYASNIVYSAGNVNGVPTLSPSATYGNEDLKNEEKHETEFGWQTKVLHNRLGFDITYYNNKIVNQILPLTVPSTVGASSVLVNVGTLRNYGLELSLTGTPIRTKNMSWDVTANLSFNRNKVVALMPGLDRLTNANLDNGSILVVSGIGQPAGDIMGYKRRTNAQGQYIINSDGYYDINFDQQVKLGNVQPKGVGGLINNINYKNFNLNFLIDFRWGGQEVSQAYLYSTGAGLFKNSLFGRDAEHGGLAYYTDKNTGKNVAANGLTQGPNGEKVYNDGIIINGVTADNKANTTIIDAPSYYLNTFTWGSWPGSGSTSTYEAAVFNNDFIKLRELSLSYSLPVKVRSKLKSQNLTFTLYGRNLFYFYKTVPDYDPEGGVGTNYIQQAISIGQGSAATRSYGASIRATF
jgi:TonB-linked SusC/RagA family outer membrane protein